MTSSTVYSGEFLWPCELSAWSYDADNLILKIQFRDGPRYSYSGVPAWRAQEFIAVGDPHTYLLTHIHGAFPLF